MLSCGQNYLQDHTNMIKIDKKVKLPPAKKGKGCVPKYPFGTMLVGYSFLYNDEPTKGATQIQNASAKANTWVKYHKSKFKFSCRIVKNGVRVWRIK